MTRFLWPVAGCLAAGFLAAGAAPALASPCGDRIAKLEGPVKDLAKEAISANTSGKATASARSGQGITGSGGSASAEAAAPEKSAEAGEGGDKAMQAKVALDEARTADKKGDAKACGEAVDRAQKQVDGAP
ncbi:MULTISPECIES: hypothetical protein [unclassified Methylobacterium]|jgi:hypothetical protein|uniref:hypothetical protein n=1 Tax=unclassified Methylobacterium TaxID=2615210 RepID=UPI0006F3FF2C|nr:MULTISPECIES: hypothetical protein [unclassified Methylobacterium]KQO65524.1 hypothetical protein ASF20_06335 [Methylobacterium sp. Leaf88]KQT73600.1 hypothetical protein ASG51_08995 [Methylobacterium sp. Leaf465]